MLPWKTNVELESLLLTQIFAFPDPNRRVVLDNISTTAKPNTCRTDHVQMSVKW